MTLFGSAPAPVQGLLGGQLFGIGKQAPPISARLPQYQERFDKKWSAFQQRFEADGIRPDVAQAIYAMDRKKLLAGQEPLSAPDTARALLAANQRQTLTQSPQRSISPLALPGNAVHDVRNIAASLFKLPQALAHEALSLPKAPGMAAEAISSASNPFEAITNLSQVPGIRMIPGSYVAGNLARGPEGFRELVEHPVFTALDVLPAVGKMAAGTKVARAALEAHELAKTGMLPNEILAQSATARPIKALMFNKLNADGQITRNMAGEIADAAARTRTGTVIRSTFAPTARSASVIKNFWDEALRQSLASTDDAGRPIPFPDRFKPVQALMEHSRAAGDLAKQFPESADVNWRVEVTKKMETGDWANMTDREVLYSTKIQDLGEYFANYSAGIGKGAYHKGEFYPTNVANALHARENHATFVGEMADLRTNIVDPTKTADEYLYLAQQELQRKDIKGHTRRLRATGYLYAADRLGVDITGDIARLRNTPLAQHPSFAIEADSTTAVPRPPIEDLLKKVQGYRSWTRIGELKNALQNEHWGQASGIIREMKTQAAHLPEAEEFLSTLDHLRKRDRVLQSFEKYSPDDATKAAADYQKLAEQKAPARFYPLIEQKAMKEVAERATTPERAREVSQLLYEHKYDELTDVLPKGKKELMDLADAAAGSWMELKRQGLNPVFVHRMAPEALLTKYPKISEIPNTPSSIQERTWDFAPYVKDASIAMEHQGLELLQRWGSEAFAEEMVTKFGKTRGDVEALAKNKAWARTATGDPRYANYETVLADIIKREWTPFKPKEYGYFWDSAKTKDLADGDWYLPKHIADNMSRWHNPRYTPFQAALDPVMKLFRTALLPLSPRWHINNIIGGGVAMSAETGLGVWKYLGDAITMVRTRQLPEELLLTMRAQSSMYGEMSYMEGRSVGRWLKEAESSRLQKLGATVETPGAKMAYVRDKFNNIVDASYTFNGFVDEMYRTMTYLHGKEKNIGKMTTAEAERVGLDLASKVLPQWAELTPLERSAMRYVFPFYGWMNFVTRYALRYPFDHPVRTSIMASVTRIALDDLGEDGLPESFLGVNFFGDEDENGNQHGWRTGAMNPFADVASNFTLAGVVSNLNPLGATITEQLGMKNGHLEAYPNLAFDPETGRLAAKPPGLLQGLVQNVIPQSGIFLGLAGFNRDFKDLVRRDPAAANRQVWQAGGFPVPIRVYNMAQEYTKRELAAHEGEATAQREALLANKRTTPYPGLVPFFKQVNALTSADLSAFIPTEETAPARLASLPPMRPSLSQTAAAGGV